MNPAPLRKNIPCHARELFVKHDGLVYPCCRVGGGDGQVGDNSRTIIGRLGDSELPERIRSFRARCRCEGRRLRPLGEGESLGGGRLNIELSLKCQGRCAFCCVFAPEYRGGRAVLPGLDDLIEAYAPADILVQGGEVLVQPESLAWLGGIRKRFPGIPILLVTNGCVELSLLDSVEELFEAVHISIAGFQPQTYGTVMGLDLERTKLFAASLCARGRTRVQLKFMATPNTIHELPLFLRWALEVSPASVAVETITIGQYVVMDTFDDYWRKIFRRTGREVKRLLPLLDGRVRLGMDVLFSSEARALLELDGCLPQPQADPAGAGGPSREDIADQALDEAWSLIDRGAAGEARAVLSEVLRSDPDFAGARHAMAIACLVEGGLEEGLAHAMAGLDANPGDPDLVCARATLLARLERHDEALACLSGIMSHAPLNWGARIRASDICRYAGRWAEALEHLDAALAIHPHLRRGAPEKRRDLLARLERRGD